VTESATERATEGAVPEIVAALTEWGITKAFWFLAYAGYPVVWLVTATDSEKEAAPLEPLTEKVRAILANAGVSGDLAARAAVSVESEETVARDWDGDWWAAMK
jgi:hypothetical protein